MAERLQLHETHRAAGAVFAAFFGWEVPQHYSFPEREYETLCHSVGLLDLSCSVVLELKDDDRARFLHGMVTNDIKSLSTGKGCYAATLTPQGRLVADLRVFCLEGSLLITAEASVRGRLEPSLRKYIIGDRPELIDRSSELALLSLQGLKATELLATITCQPVPIKKPFEHYEAALCGQQVRVCRVDRTPAGGFDLLVRRDLLRQFWQSILDQGQPLGIRPVGFASLNTQRIEAGLPLFGIDMEEDTLPIEAGLERNAISFNKGCYIGQESVARITYRGHVNRKLSGLILTGGFTTAKGDRILKENQEVGWITSSVYSPRLQQAIALGYLRRESQEPGTTVAIETREGVMEANVTALPFL